MNASRRQFLTTGAAGVAAYVCPVKAAPRGINAAQFGVRPGTNDDQSRALQSAIDQAARARLPLLLAPGVYRAGNLILPAGAHLAGTSGETRITLTEGPALLSAEGANGIVLTVSP
jgi:uncharacterized secreted repeat protein (TIGR03808 family)